MLLTPTGKYTISRFPSYVVAADEDAWRLNFSTEANTWHGFRLPNSLLLLSFRVPRWNGTGQYPASPRLLPRCVFPGSLCPAGYFDSTPMSIIPLSSQDTLAVYFPEKTACYTGKLRPTALRFLPVRCIPLHAPHRPCGSSKCKAASMAGSRSSPE